MDFIKRLKSIKYKVILILFVAILGLTTALAQQRPNAPKPYTVMVYMNPSDLESGGFSEGSINRKMDEYIRTRLSFQKKRTI